MIKRFLFLIIVKAILFILLSIIFSVYIDKGPLSPNFKTSKTIGSIFPQGWGFFTKSPRTPVETLYQVTQNLRLKKVTRTNTAAKNLFGLSRGSRRINIEQSRLKLLVDLDSLWFDSNTESLTNIDFFLTDSISSIQDTIYDYHKIRPNQIYIMTLENKKPWLYYMNNLKIDPNFKMAIFEFKK